MSRSDRDPRDSALEHELARLHEQGYVVLPRLLDADALAEMRAVLAPHLGQHRGRNPFEGQATERIYTLVARHRVFQDLVEHPRILRLCDRLLQPGYLLTASQAICIYPGERAQAWHTDDSFYAVPRPRPAISVSVIFSVDDFTAENGATQIVPGSHLLGDEVVSSILARLDFTPRPASPGAPEGNSDVAGAPLPEDLADRVIDAVMPAGSAIVFLGTLVHRGGANRSTHPRLALSNQYCQPWARQQENYTLAVPPDQVRAQAMSRRVRALLGYSIHPPFMGHVGGLHPERLTERLADAEKGPGDS
ncbi:MAG TPA: phytanoyl-CoA dioxygenase family protein [Haliangium sp.]|nr:phytanoyl-CoA dioxygenase family protein [Haliangium sp.]